MHRLLLALLAGLSLLASGCSSDAAPPAAEPAPFRYVALGDSYAAAPGVPETSGADGCFRSSGNYPNQVAAAVDGVALSDESCSGATTADVLEKQVPSLSGETDLVTLGIGGNDFNLFGGVLASCLSGTPCGAAAAAQVDDLLPRIEDNIGRLLDVVVESAPAAMVVVVGYPDLVPDSGTCPALPLAPGDYRLVDDATLRLTEALERQASGRDLVYVDVHTASQGHDVCADDPWVNGSEVAPDGTIPFHPFATEQTAVAELVVDAAEVTAFR